MSCFCPNRNLRGGSTPPFLAGARLICVNKFIRVGQVSNSAHSVLSSRIKSACRSRYFLSSEKDAQNRRRKVHLWEEKKV